MFLTPISFYGVVLAVINSEYYYLSQLRCFKITQRSQFYHTIITIVSFQLRQVNLRIEVISKAVSYNHIGKPLPAGCNALKINEIITPQIFLYTCTKRNGFFLNLAPGKQSYLRLITLNKIFHTSESIIFLFNKIVI